MLDPKLIRDNPQIVAESLKKRGSEFDVQRLVVADEKRRDVIKAVEALKSEKNTTSDQIAKLKKAGGDAQEPIERLRSLGKRIERTGTGIEDG